jgi:hypothetical protein
MRRILAVAALVALTSCAHVPPAGATAHYAIRPVTGYVSLNDDASPTCATVIPVLASIADSVWVRCEWWQSGSVLRADSTHTPRACWLTFAGPASVPAASVVTSRWWSRDAAGTSCSAPYDQVPTVTLVRPAAVSGLAVAP